MWRRCWMVLAVLAAGCVMGCGGSGDSGQETEDAAATAEGGHDQAAVPEGPARAVAEFLGAMRAGDDEKTASLLSEAARKTAVEMNLSIAPPGSDTARFKVGEVEWLAGDGARVACTWTDLDEAGQPRTEQATLMVRRERHGWRIAGLAYRIFPDKPPLLLNLEDPEDLKRKQQWVREEVLRRTQAADSRAQQPDSQAQRPKNPGNSPLR